MRIKLPTSNFEVRMDDPGVLYSRFDVRWSALSALRPGAFCCQWGLLFDKFAQRIEWLTTMNESQVRKKILLRLIGHPLVIAPSVLGVSGCIGIWALNWPTGLGLFAGLAGVLGSAGVYLTRLILDGGKTASAVLAEQELQEQQATQAVLDDLDRRLAAGDDDARPEIALRDMRALVRAFDEFTGIPSAAIIDVRSRVQQLFDHSVHSLEQTLRIGDTAKKLDMPEARKPLLIQREKIIEDIQACVKQLGDTLAALQQLDAGTQSTGELTRLREELDQSLEIAGRVESRLNSLLDRTESDIHSSLSRVSGNNQKGN